MVNVNYDRQAQAVDASADLIALQKPGAVNKWQPNVGQARVLSLLDQGKSVVVI